MSALTKAEKWKLSSGIEHYQTIISDISVSMCMDHIQSDLINRYQQNPAILRAQEREIILPFCLLTYMK